MKKNLAKRTLIYPSLITLLSCSHEYNNRHHYNSYIETKPSFYSLKQGNLVEQKWYRDNKTLKVLHETFKKIGYNNLIDENFYNSNPFLEMGIYINRPLRYILDSLELTYPLDTIEIKYYREFWNRRIDEGNDSIVYEIIKEINRSIGNETTEIYDEELVNDTLYNLLRIEYLSEPLTKEIAMNNFMKLKRFGFHQSAFNILFGEAQYDYLELNRDSLEKTLTPTKENKNIITAWIYYDRGP